MGSERESQNERNFFKYDMRTFKCTSTWALWLDKAKLTIGLFMDSFYKNDCFVLNPTCKAEEPQMHSNGLGITWGNKKGCLVVVVVLVLSAWRWATSRLIYVHLFLLVFFSMLLDSIFWLWACEDKNKMQRYFQFIGVEREVLCKLSPGSVLNNEQTFRPPDVGAQGWMVTTLRNGENQRTDTASQLPTIDPSLQSSDEHQSLSVHWAVGYIPVTRNQTHNPRFMELTLFRIQVFGIPRSRVKVFLFFKYP